MRSETHQWLTTLSLFGSLSTLLCCAFPALLVTLGAGAALAGLMSTAPWLAFLSQYKGWTFTVSGILLLGAGIMQWRTRHASCPIDPKQAKACLRLRRISRWVYGISLALYLIGGFFAFFAVYFI